MSHGPQSAIDVLAQRLLYRWVPKWYEAFHEVETGLFYERVGHAFRPKKTGRRRVLTQCRQLSVYADAQARGAFPYDLDQHFDALIKYYHVPETGGWRFSIDDENQPLDDYYDLYAQAFVLFALAHVGHDKARSMAVSTVQFIDKNFRAQKGFYEALESDLTPRAERRRHESHMHLLEACLFATEKWDDTLFSDLANELTVLFFSDFYHDGVLSEYFSDDLQPLPEKGKIIVEPGHYGEWIWLLKKQAQRSGNVHRYDAACTALLDFANQYGWDHEYGGIFDELAPDGSVIADTKRIWPFCELIKANALMLDTDGSDKTTLKATIHRMLKVFRASYIQERGFWAEWLARDLTPMTDYMPGTTPYHVYFGIMETRDVLKRRGPTRSVHTWAQNQLFRARRMVSNGVRAVRYRFK